MRLWSWDRRVTSGSTPDSSSAGHRWCIEGTESYLHVWSDGATHSIVPSHEQIKDYLQNLRKESCRAVRWKA